VITGGDSGLGFACASAILKSPHDGAGERARVLFKRIPLHQCRL
jgi:NAD(P)-dependent dehydrogenase (short-subunit alcohol dehydrogenase family)